MSRATGVTGPTGMTGATGPAGYGGPYMRDPKPEWHRLHRLSPRRLLGYTWYRADWYRADWYEHPDYQGGYTYRTDKQMADELLAQMKPTQQYEAKAEATQQYGYWRK